jgi:hypothetical protein
MNRKGMTVRARSNGVGQIIRADNVLAVVNLRRVQQYSRLSLQCVRWSIACS